MQLRDYQQRAVEALGSHSHAGKRRLLLVAPTGAGKTVIASYVMALARTGGDRVLFLAHRRELIGQTVRKLLDAGVPEHDLGVIMADDPRTRPGAWVQVASVDTLRNREKPPANLVMIDEAHRSLAQTYLDLIDHYSSQGATIIGLTATPYRADGRGLGDVYEVLEIVATPQQLISEGFIVEPRVFSAGDLDLSGVRVRGGDYVEADLAAALDQGQLVGDIVSHWQRHARGMRTVAFAVNVAHSQHIAERFRAAGVPAEHLDGSTPTNERDAILARLESGETLVVSNCGVLCEGWDQPSVKCAILARPTKSTGLYLQQAGRILRPWNDASAIILDHAGNALRHGLPQDDRDLSLDPTGKISRASAPTKKCPECHRVIPAAAQICPECGHEFVSKATPPTTERSGELIELEAVPVETLKAAWDALGDKWRSINEERIERGRQPMKPGWIWHRFRERFHRRPPPGCRLPTEIATPREKQAALEELRRIANQRGYHPRWALHRFREKFGHGPEVLQWHG